MGNLGYPYTPTHPGEVIKEEIEYRGISQKVLSQRCYNQHFLFLIKSEVKNFALFFGSNEKQKKESLSKLLFYVRAKGLEPPRRKTLDPKSSAATNYATPALFCLGLQI